MPKEKFKRRQLIVDRTFQLSIAMTLVSVLLSFTILLSLAILVVPGKYAFDMISGEQVRHLVLAINGIYFFAVAMALTAVTVMITHRVAGPAWVLTNAIDGLVVDDFERRWAIRKKDYLQGLSAAVGRLVAQLRKREARRRNFLTELDRLLARGDLDAARELVARAQSKLEPRVQEPV